MGATNWDEAALGTGRMAAAQHSAPSSPPPLSFWVSTHLLQPSPRTCQQGSAPGTPELLVGQICPLQLLMAAKLLSARDTHAALQDFARASPQAPIPGQRRNISLHSNLPGRDAEPVFIISLARETFLWCHVRKEFRVRVSPSAQRANKNTNFPGLDLFEVLRGSLCR